MFRLLIFDLDGTLFDTTRALYAAGTYALREMGLPPVPRSVYAAASGKNIRGYVEQILEAAGDPRPGQRIDAFWELYQPKQIAYNVSDEFNVPYPGIRELIAAARQKGVLLGVLSNKDQESVTELVDHFFGVENFALALGHSPDRPPKPDPAGIRFILRTLNVAPEEALYVGDTEVDLQTAENAGVPAAAAVWGYRERDFLASFHPAYLPDTPFDLLDLL